MNNVFNRPLFRQAGGPAQPMPQDMAMAPPQAPPEAGMVQQAEDMALAQGQQLGAQYAQEMIANVEGAESTEDLINAIRGNQKPIEARIEELGGLVGMEDAQATPESVLALVQPVIMMTEEGAMNSGIGELMQGVMGDIEMTTDMSGGVGSLMAAGAQEAPAPQNFNQGGAVQRYALGGIAMPSAFVPMLDEEKGADYSAESLLQPIEVTAKRRESLPESDETASEGLMKKKGGFGDSVKSYYDELRPLFQEIIGETEAEKDYAKAQTMFDIAKAGLNLAAGTDPRTGKSTTSLPFASQLAAAASELPGQIQARAAETRKLDQGLKTAALQGAMEKAQTDQKFMQDVMLANIAAASKMTQKGLDERIVLDKDGNEVAVLNVNNPADLATYNNYKSSGQYTFRKMTAGGAETLTNYIIQSPDGGRELVESFDNGKTYIGSDGKAVRMPTGEGFSIAAVGQEQVAALQRGIGVQKKYQDALRQHLAGTSSPSTEAISSPTANVNAFITSATAKKDAIEAWTGEELGNLDQAAKDIIAGTQMAWEAANNATGPVARFKSGMNKYIGFLSKLSPEDREREQQAQYLRAIRFIGKVALVSNSRFPVAEMVLASELFPDPDVFFTDPETQAGRLQTIKSVTDQLYEHNLSELASGDLDTTQRREAEASLREVELLRSMLGEIPAYGSEANDPNRLAKARSIRGTTGVQ